MYMVNPKQWDKYFLKMLLLQVKGAKSFDDIKYFDEII